MGDLIFPDFQSKDRRYTKGGGIDDLDIVDVEIADAIRKIGRDGHDTAPCEMPPVQPNFDEKTPA